jgi:hypothetical protein
MFRIDLIKNGEQRPLVTEIPDFQAAFRLWQMHNQPCEEWDRLVIVNEEEET